MNAKRKYRWCLALLLAPLVTALIAAKWISPPNAYAAAAGQLQGQHSAEARRSPIRR